MTIYRRLGGREIDVIHAEDYARELVAARDARGEVPGIVHVVEADTPEHAEVRREETPSSAVFVTDDDGYDELFLDENWGNVGVLYTVGWTERDLEENA